MKVYDAKPSFAGGELSPLLAARVDLAQYAIGGRKIENFLVLPQGGLFNRPGTMALAPERTYEQIRLVPFVFSEDNPDSDAFCLAFGNGFVDVYGTYGFVYRIGGSPYLTQHLKDLRWLQSADYLYLFHNDVPVHVLKRYNSVYWEFERVNFEMGPFRDMNTDEELQLRVMWSGVPGEYNLDVTNKNGDMGLDGDGNLRYLFTPEWVGDLIKIEQKIKSDSHSHELASAGDSFEVLYVFGPFTWRTEGKWTGTIQVDRCLPEDWIGKNKADWEWEKFKTYVSASDAEENFAFSGAVTEYAQHFRFTLVNVSSSKKPFITWDYEGGVIERVFRIIRYEDPWFVIATPADGIDIPEGMYIEAFRTDAWAVGAFGKLYGYPALGIFHQERLVLARTRADRQSIWASKSASWHNFGTSIPSKDTDSLMITLASKQVNEIRGLASRGDLLIFTSGSEWTAKAGSKSDVFTPASIIIVPSGYHGSADLPPLEVGTTTLFVQKFGQAVQSLGYNLEIDGYASTDLSVLAAHMLEGNPVRAWDYQQTPWGIVWLVLSDGTAVAVTMQREHQVNAWTRQMFGSRGVRDVCCIPGNGQDEVFFAMGENGEIMVEILKRRVETNDDTFFESDNSAVASTFESLDWELPANGTLQCRHKQIPVVTFRLYGTTGINAGIMTETSDKLDELDVPGPHFTGDVRLVIPGGAARRCRVRVENSEARPVTILGMFPEVVIPNEQ